MRTRNCQACGGESLDSFYETRNIPSHSCLMLPTREQARAFPRGDLELVFCRDCGFIGNARFEVGLNNYNPDYEETQAYSPRFMRFMNEICERQIAHHELAPGKTALEIGCGKGEFLVMLCERSGCNGIGFDPGYRPERTQSEAARRLTFVRDLYGPRYAHVAADYIACRHTLEHIGPVGEFLRLVRQTIGDRTEVRVFFELPDMERILIDGAFWDIYYEHCSYFTRGSLARAFRAARFDLLSLYKAYDDQYLMIEARPTPKPTEPQFHHEHDLSDTTHRVDEFRKTVTARIDELKNSVRKWKAGGQRLAIWGSGSKCVSLLSALGLNDEIDAVVDINPHKHGKFLAGSGIEIMSPASLNQVRPDVVLIMNSIYTDEIQADLNARGLRPQLVPL
jgi:hypothetical protein